VLRSLRPCNGSFGTMFDHVGIAVSDLAVSERFYRTVLSVLGVEPSHADAELVEWDARPGRPQRRGRQPQPLSEADESASSTVAWEQCARCSRRDACDGSSLFSAIRTVGAPTSNRVGRLIFARERVQNRPNRAAGRAGRCGEFEDSSLPWRQSA
jgi:catechol 2,3-dioxygenase-like lactoylglutathione lyase family enzyme